MTWKKYLSALILGACFLGSLQAQTYTVVHISGQCSNFDTGKSLSIGETLQPSATVDLGSVSGRMVLWEKKEGLILLAPRKTEQGKALTHGKFAELKQPLPTPREDKESFGSMEDLQKHFDGRRYLILDHSWLIPEPAFRLTGDTILFYKFQRPKANAQVNRKVEHRGDSLQLSAKLILDMNGKPVPADDANSFELFWMDLKTKGYKKLARFEFVFVDEAQVAKEVGLLLSEVKKLDMDPSMQMSLVRQYLAAAYGDPDLHNLRQWLETNGLR